MPLLPARAKSRLAETDIVAWSLDAAAITYLNLFKPHPRNAVLCSYPKSGRTWLRFMLLDYQIRLFEIDFELTLKSFSEISPNLSLFSRMGLKADRTPKKMVRIIGTHSPYPSLFRWSKLIYLERDPLDVLVSYFYHQTARGLYEDCIESFVWSEQGVDRLVEYVNKWRRALNQHRNQKWLAMTYEDMKSDPASALTKCLNFLEIEIDSKKVAAGVEASQASRMRKLEAETGTYDFSTSDLTQDPNAFHVRAAKVGGYRKELSPETITSLQDRLAEQLTEPAEV